MFRSIQWKLVAMFLLLVVAVIIVVGTFLSKSIVNFYQKDFKTQMDSVFEHVDFQSDAVNAQQLEEKLKIYIGRLGIDSYRNYFILNGLGGVIASSNLEMADTLENSENIIAAINGRKGTEVRKDRPYMDYAVPIVKDGQTQYIIYIRDEKTELKEITAELFSIILQALLFGLVISVVLGFFLSSTITTPIASLTQKAEKLAMGQFDQEIKVKSDDEIGKLTTSFNYMSSELKRTLDEIATEKNKIETILLHMTDGVMAFNTEGNVIHANPASKKMLGIDNIEALTFDELFKEINLEISLEQLLYLKDWKTLEKEINYNGRHLKAFFATSKTEKEKAGGVVVVLQDVTEQQKLDMARREFVANVSHELRTPLTTIKSYAETLLAGALEDPETAENFLRVINNESDRMTRLVKDLLILSKLDHKQTQWNKTRFNLKNLIEEVVEKLMLNAKEQGHELSFTPTGEIPDIFADRDRIEQVLKNILSNAIKYTPEGGKIFVYAGRIGNEVYIKIKDNGIGIPKEDLPRIFERFYRVDKARSREQGGTGLGLAIAKEIITAHGGTISIDSEQDKGTEVVIRLPVEKIESNVN